MVGLIPRAKYVGSRKDAATFGDATCMKLFWVLEKLIETSRRGEELEFTWRWRAGLHVEVKHYDLDEQLIFW